MKRSGLLLFLTLAAIAAVAESPSATSALSSSSQRSSLIAVSSDGSFVLVVNPDSGSISVIDVVSRLVSESPVGQNPQTVVLSADSSAAFVTVRDEDVVAVVNLIEKRVETKIDTCREPFGVVASGTRLFVSCFASAQVGIIDLVTRRQVAAIDVEIDPRGLALSSDGSRLYVTHFTTGKLSVIDLETSRLERVITTLADSNLSQSIFIDGMTKLAYLPQTRSNASNRALLFDTTVFPIVSVIDLASGINVPSKRISIDIAGRPSGIPIDAVRSGNRLFVVHAASNDLAVIDLTTSRTIAQLPTGAAPHGMALSPDQTRLYVNNTLDGTVTVVDTLALRVDETIAVTSLPLPPAILNGKRLFNSSEDTRLAKDRWMSCATCHFDGGMDRQTWFFRDGPRNTPTLLGVRDTAPFHWSGDLDELHDVENTIRVNQAGSGLATGPSHCEPACDQSPPNAGRSSDLDDLVAFMGSLRLRPRKDSRISEASVRGREIFFSPHARCSECHPFPLFTDRRRHDVATVTSDQEKKGPLINTPTLLGLADTAPYFHDGSAATLGDVVIRSASAGSSHGDLSGMDAQQLQDLVTFIETIGSETPRRRPARRSP